jgi:hypothetical protein
VEFHGVDFGKSLVSLGTGDINQKTKLRPDDVPRPAKMQVESAGIRAAKGYATLAE